LDLRLDAGGITLNTESLISIMIGGVAFDTPTSLVAGGPAHEGHIFRLYETREAIFERTFTEKRHFILRFAGSIRGLSIGAPVEFRGIKIGQVIDIDADFDEETLTPRITVLIETEPQRLDSKGDSRMDPKTRIEMMVAKGLRAQLKTGSLLTGQLFVEVDFFPEAPPAKVLYGEQFPEIPTIPAPLQLITARVNQLLSKIETVPIEKIGQDLGDTLQNVKNLTASAELRQAIRDLDATLKETRELAQNLNMNVAPAITATLDQAQQTLVSVESTLGKDSPLQYEIREAMEELGDAARALRVLLDYLERHPDALIFGKGNAR
jgi:paraquat-inducible protein B